MVTSRTLATALSLAVLFSVAACSNVQHVSPPSGQPLDSKDSHYAQQLAHAACLELEKVYAGPDPVSDPHLTAFMAYSQMMTRLDRPLALADKAKALDPRWTPISAYIGSERDSWSRDAKWHSDGVYTSDEKREAEDYFNSMMSDLKLKMGQLNRTCAEAGAVVELEVLGGRN